MSSEGGCREGGEHVMFSTLAGDFNPSQVIRTDWCVRCGAFADDDKPHIVYKGQRREVEDVEPPEGLL